MFAERKPGLIAAVVGVIVLIGLGVGGAAAVMGSSDSSQQPGASYETATGGEVEALPETTTTVAAPAAAEAPAPTTIAPAPATTKATTPKKTTTTAPAAAEVASPAPAVTVSTLAARRTPSSAEVQEAISTISSMVSLPLFFSISPANVADVGNQVCTAFDQGKSFAEVKATGLATVSQYVYVSPAAADYAVRTAVKLYCPGYQSKLV